MLIMQTMQLGTVPLRKIQAYRYNFNFKQISIGGPIYDICIGTWLQILDCGLKQPPCMLQLIITHRLLPHSAWSNKIDWQNIQCPHATQKIFFKHWRFKSLISSFCQYSNVRRVCVTLGLWVCQIVPSQNSWQ